MNASELSTEGHFWTSESPCRLVELYEETDGLIVDDHQFTPAQARVLAEQIDSGQSQLPPDEARKLAIELFRSADTVERSPVLPDAAIGVYARLQMTDGDSWSWHVREEHGTCRLGLLAMHDLMTNLGLDRQAVLAALDVLRDHHWIHDLQVEPGMAPRVRLGPSPMRRDLDL